MDFTNVNQQDVCKVENLKEKHMTANKEKLFGQFPPISTAEWKDKVIADLKGADFDKKLVWRTNEGFNVQPMYRAEDIVGLNNRFFARRIPLCERNKMRQRMAYPSRYFCRESTRSQSQGFGFIK